MPRPDKYQTAPVDTAGMPPGIPYIVGNEAAERFSFYGMRTILVVYMTEFLLNSSGALALMPKNEANAVYHNFNAAVYFFPVLGGIIADAFFGKYRTIIWLSLVYCLGHLALAMDETRVGLYLGLFLIAVGAGGIKPCVSSNVGDQFGPRNRHLIERVYGWFYIAINLGAFGSSLLTPYLLRYGAEDLRKWLEPMGFHWQWDRLGPRLAFGTPGVLMLLATIIFWLGRNRYVHIPPRGMQYFRETFTAEGLRAIRRLCSIYIFVAVFWMLYDQTGGAWVNQAKEMNRVWLGHKWDAAQIQAVNPLLILLFVPLFTLVIYPLAGRVVKITPLRKVTVGFFLVAAAFAVSGLIQVWIDRGQHPHVLWQVLAYVILTAAEVLVSVTCLEFSYTQAPPQMKSLIMSLFMLSDALGNFLAGQVNHAIEHNRSIATALAGANYYWFFTAVMLVATCGFIPVAMLYRGNSYIRESEPSAE